MSQHLNEVTKKLEDLGLVILKDEKGEYVARGTRNIKINGENIKTILADAVKQLDDVQVINHLNITDYIVKDGAIAGALGFDMRTGRAYEIRAKAVLCATGRTIRAFPAIRCGTVPSTRAQATPWASGPVQR